MAKNSAARNEQTLSEKRPLSLVPEPYTEDFASEELRRRNLERRAVEAINWGIPAVSFDRMVQATLWDAKGDFNEIVYWSGRSDWKNQTLTPNPDVIYFMPFINTRECGPMVLEIPPAEGGSITGSLYDCWQSALEDVGPAGMDKGMGGKYLILPLGYDAWIPDGYIPIASNTWQTSALLRSIPKGGSDADIAKAVNYAMQIKLYPLSEARNPSETIFVDTINAEFNAIIPYDLRFFESLNRVIQEEPWLERDKAMIDTLKAIGIEKGKPFEPDEQTKEILRAAACEAHSWFNARFETSFPPFYPDKKWCLVVPPEIMEAGFSFERKDHYPIDARGLLYSYAFSSVKHIGVGQFYLWSMRDQDGNFLHGRKRYKLTVPANVPVRQYWSAVAYDRGTHAFIRDLPWSSRSSLTPDLQTNKDGSVDIFIGPNAPEGFESNWIPTREDSEFEVFMRFYGPEKALSDQSWTLPDIAELP